MNTPNIYVIIVTYNGSEWIDACFGSLRRSTIPLKTVVVDNCSKDNTVELIRANYPEVHLICNPNNGGFGEGNNIAIKYARQQGADYYFLLNQDAWVFPDTIANLLEFERADDGIISPVHLNGSGKNFDAYFKDYLFHARASEPDQTLLAELDQQGEPIDVKFVNAAAWLLPSQTVERVGGFSPLFNHYGEDNNYCDRVLYHQLKIRVAPKARICHGRQNANNPLQMAWVKRHLLIIYSNPKFSNWGAIWHTRRTQLQLIRKLPLLLLTGRTKDAKMIFDAYINLFKCRKQVVATKAQSKIAGAQWL